MGTFHKMQYSDKISHGISLIGSYFPSSAESWTAAATVVIALFTIVLAISTTYQARLTRKTIELARQEFLSTNRPKIRFKHVWLASEFFHNRPIVGRVTCVNVGTSNATIFEYAMRFLVIKTGKSLPMPSEFQPVRIGLLLPSGVNHTFDDLTDTLQKDDIVAIRAGRLQFLFIGYVHYRDDLGRFRTGAFCRVMRKPSHPVDPGRLAVFNDPNYEYED
jgi:hypothetical protein